MKSLCPRCGKEIEIIEKSNSAKYIFGEWWHNADCDITIFEAMEAK